MTITLRKGTDILQRLDEGPGTNFTDTVAKNPNSGSFSSSKSPPGTQRKFFFDLNTIYNLSTNGNYDVQAKKLIAKMDQHAKAEVISGKATFRITSAP